MKKQNKKKTIITVTAVVLVVVIGLGVWFGVSRGRSEPVKVFAFNYVGMTEYWGDSQESYGPVSTDKIQTVFLSSTQTVTEMKVAQGDMVKKGDVLMTFDTSLSDLQLERKRLEVEKLKLDQETARKRLREIQNMTPMSAVDVDDSGDYGDEGDPNAGDKLTGSYQLSTNSDYDGSMAEKALICWLNTAAAVDNGILEAARQKAEEYQNKNYVPDPTEEPTVETTEETTETTTETTESPSEKPSETPNPPENPGEGSSGGNPGEGSSGGNPGGEDGENSSASAAENPDEKPAITVSDYYMVFKVTEGNMSLGNRLTWQGLHIYRQGGGFVFKFFDASVVPDHSIITDDPDNTDPTDPDMPDPGSGYTAAQLAQMRSEQEKKIKELGFKIKVAEADYKIKQTEMSDGNIYADFDGKVVSVLTEEEAKTKSQPVLKVSGGGGYYVTGTISELERDKLELGSEVTISDWRNGTSCTGTVQSIGDFPSTSNYYSSNNNPNASFYPFTVLVDEDANLVPGYYVDMEYSLSDSTDGIYLSNPFLRTEQGASFVYVQGENGKLERRNVVTGKSVWGSYTQILSGITMDDLIAFPYGKNVKPGVPTEQGDYSTLYEEN